MCDVLASFAHKTILVEDSNLVSLCWKIEAGSETDLRRYSTPQEALAALQSLALSPEDIFVVDVDFAGLDSMDGVQFALVLRDRGLKNPIHLYSGFVENIPATLLTEGVVAGVHSKEDSPRDILRRIRQ